MKLNIYKKGDQLQRCKYFAASDPIPIKYGVRFRLIGTAKIKVDKEEISLSDIKMTWDMHKDVLFTLMDGAVLEILSIIDEPDYEPFTPLPDPPINRSIENQMFAMLNQFARENGLIKEDEADVQYVDELVDDYSFDTDYDMPLGIDTDGLLEEKAHQDDVLGHQDDAAEPAPSRENDVVHPSNDDSLNDVPVT